MPSLVGSRSRTIGSIPETRIREDLRPACEYASVHSRRPKAGVGRNGFLPSRSERFELFDAHRSSPIVASLAGENQVAGFRATAERAGVNMIEGGEIRRAMEPAPAGPDVDPAIAAAPAVAFEDEGEQLPASRCLHARSVCRGFAPVGAAVDLTAHLATASARARARAKAPVLQPAFGPNSVIVLAAPQT